MTRPTDTDWRVLPHDPIRQLAENLWWVEGDLPGMKLRRAMTVARLKNGELVLHNGVALDDAGMAALEALGRPAYLIVPNGWHRLDAARYKARYPDIVVLCPTGSRKRVTQKVQVDATYDERPEPCPGDTSVRLERFGAEDTQGAEGVMLVRSSDGVTAVFGDALFNLEHQRGFFWWLYGRVMGATGGLKVTPLGKLLLVKGGARTALRERLSAPVNLARIVPGHGAPVVDNAAEAALAVAASLR